MLSCSHPPFLTQRTGLVSLALPEAIPPEIFCLVSEAFHFLLFVNFLLQERLDSFKHRLEHKRIMERCHRAHKGRERRYLEQHSLARTGKSSMKTKLLGERAAEVSVMCCLVRAIR